MDGNFTFFANVYKLSDLLTASLYEHENLFQRANKTNWPNLKIDPKRILSRLFVKFSHILNLIAHIL